MKTLFALLAEYESVHAPLEVIAQKYLGLDRRQAFRDASAGQLPFPVLRLRGQKSPWMVDLRDIADWWDKERTAAQADWKKMRSL
jgi:hypothetical protein